MANFAKPDVPRFAVEVYQNEFLPEGGREVNAIVTVTATGGGTLGGLPAHDGAAGAASAVALMVDCSGSMDHPSSKMRHARDATRTAVAALRDGTRFAVIAGTHVAREVYPGGGRQIGRAHV